MPAPYTRIAALNLPVAAKIISAVTEYDRAESRKRFYNRHALALYLGAAQDAEAALSAGVPVRRAVLEAFNGRLADCILTACGEPKQTRAELLADL